MSRARRTDGPEAEGVLEVLRDIAGETVPDERVPNSGACMLCGEPGFWRPFSGALICDHCLADEVLPDGRPRAQPR